MAMFDLERFIADCDSAVLTGGQEAAHEVLARAIADPGGVLAVLGEPHRAELRVLHRSPRLTILNPLWPHAGASRSSHMGGDRRLLRPRGQHLLAPPPAK